MNKRIAAFLGALCMLLTLTAGCGGGAVTSDPDPVSKDPVPQLTVAMNPLFVYDDGTAVVAYNDIKNAMKADYDSAGLTALASKTGWKWAYGGTDGWTLRATYDLARWCNGAGVTAKKTNAYAFNAAGDVSVMTYDTALLDLAAYGDAPLEKNGLLLSVTGKEQEGLCYTVQQDGVLNMLSGSVTAVEAVGGVTTGFLAEDGTPRKAAVTILANERILWSGTLCNSTAGDGTAVPALRYPQIENVKVSAGDTIVISVQLDAEANRPEDITTPEDTRPDDSTVSGGNSDVDMTPDTSTDSDTTKPTGDIPFIYDYASRFVLVRQSDAPVSTAQIAFDLRTRMEQILDAEVMMRNEKHSRTDYEIIVGVVDGLPLSASLHKDLLGYRVNHADDYVIRLDGTRIYLAGANDIALQKAVDTFLTTYCTGDKATVPADLNLVHREKKHTLLADGVNLAAFTIRTQRYSSTWETDAARELQQFLMAETGYVLPIVKGGKASAHDLQVGPQNDGVNALWNSDETRFVGAQDSGYLKGTYDAYTIAVKDGHLAVNGGSSYAVNAGVKALMTLLRKTRSLSAGYTQSAQYDGGYSLSNNYGLVWAEEFDYNEGSDAANEKAVKKNWYISGDTTPGPTKLGPDIWDEQRRPGIYGENYWVKDGMLWEITKWAPYGYDAVRLTTQDRMYFMYGMLEVRMVPGMRNGACSSVWTHWDGLSYTDAPEFDIYENFGKDAFIHAAISWKQGENATYRTHFGAGVKEIWTYPEEGRHFYDSFHYIGFEWSPDTVAYYIDGKCTYSHDIRGTEYDGLRSGTVLKLANGVGTRTYTWGVDGSDPYDCLDDVTRFYETQLVDYARIYQLDSKDYILRTR